MILCKQDGRIIVNACARRLGSRTGPRTGKEERGFLARVHGRVRGGARKVGPRMEGAGGGGGSQKGLKTPFCPFWTQILVWGEGLGYGEGDLIRVSRQEAEANN